uniref:Uncharacterized protein n=1 Tax=Anguilla anguilla TaxID=7936 RepID=A0A0E9PU25_ANGAN
MVNTVDLSHDTGGSMVKKPARLANFLQV